MSEVEQRLRQAVAEVLKVPPETITEDSSPETIPSWDSLNHLLLISHLEIVFNVETTTEEVVGIGCVADIKKVLEGHGVGF